MSPDRIAVVGAGVAGLVCARRLAAAGHAVTVFEKSRGLGGRMATRRRDGLQFDHGAPWLRASAPATREFVLSALEAGAAEPWSEAPEGVDGEVGAVFVGLPGMSDLARPLAAGLEIRLGMEVAGLVRSGGRWRVGTGETGERNEAFDRVVLTVPAPQAARLCAGVDDGVDEALRDVAFAPCYTLMLAFDGRPDWPDAVRDPSDGLTLLLRDSAKSGRPRDAECWVAHASEVWSRANLEMERQNAATALLELLESRMGSMPPVRSAVGHRWRYSQATRTLRQEYLAAADGSLLLGGDWATGRTLDDAARSGAAMAAAVLS